jgi:hypothetical protein
MPLRCATAIIHPDSRDLDGRISGSLAAFKFAIWARFKKLRSDSFWKDFATHPILLFQKMRGWLRLHAPTAIPASYPAGGTTFLEERPVDLLDVDAAVLQRLGRVGDKNARCDVRF